MSDKPEDEAQVKKKPVLIRNTTDIQRLKLEKLMKNPEKPVMIPEKPKTKGMPSVPDFVRNVMGSSAGAGSGEFHVYRHLRRKEYARQKYMKEKGEQERLDNTYRDKLEANKRMADEKTAKKRAKRLKKKTNKKMKPISGEKKIEASSTEELTDEEVVNEQQECTEEGEKKDEDEEINNAESVCDEL